MLKHKVMPELTLVLIGDRDSIEIGPSNILLDHDEKPETQEFSSRLCDLCGQHISVINMLGQQSSDRVPFKKGIHAFILLLPNGRHSSCYTAAVQWLERTYGKESLSYLMTVVTHELSEECDGAFTDLKANSSFVESRYHTCTRSMREAEEISALLEKIDVMVSENNPQCYSGPMCDANDEKEYLDHQPHREERTDSSVIQQNPPGELEKKTGKTECDLVKETGDVEKKSEEQKSENESQPPTSEEQSTLNRAKNETNESAKMSEETERKNQYQRETEKLLQRLHLQDKQQQKMTAADLLKISRPVKPDCDVSEQDVAHTFLHRLMMLDYRARYVPVKQDSPEVSSVQANDNIFDTLFSATVDSDRSQKTHVVHPMDVQMAVFHCSDSFLKQNIVTKLSKCQYALPLLVPDPVTMDINCPLWTFRQISKTWKTTEITDESSSVTLKCLPICKAPTALVSFFRLGSLPLFKSQLINSLINDRHSTFFHRNCPGSTKSRHFMDGVAEIAWYCPAGKPNDSFTDCIAFCNLHGDALSFEKQRDILTEKSSVSVVLVPTLDQSHPSVSVISALCKSPKPFIILIADDEGGAVQIGEGKYKMGLKDQSQSDVSEETKRIIRNILSGPHSSFQLESMADVPGIKVDEDDTVCQKGKTAAQRILNLLHGKDVSKVKSEFLPCQGELWHSWSRTNKELYHLTGKIEKEKSEKQEQLMKIRQKQCAASCSELMKLFIESLSSSRSTDKDYFLKWTQIFFDNLSTDDLSWILHKYDQKWSEVVELKKKQSDQLTIKQKELEQVSAELQSATFGVEHIFREMGQIYEAHEALEKRPERVKTDWSKYPEMAADLMILGQPMELMDGDAGHVPLEWISSLLDEVIKKLGDKKVFVLSILGIQSSGKSTMLNAMFGLQFAVSAGRCTKGAFMQLVTVSEEMKEELKFDYVLVVDTEGLRALELAGTNTLHHDNELATFVVGLGNMTLINIFGENPAEMQDVLQIVVQAFMRMKGVRLSPSCVFVHQNVPDITAAEKNMDGKRRLQEKLDQMTKLSAKEEGCVAECFSDIIEFDVQKDVKYFAQLWEGSPPMAPPNPGYSDSIQDLKSYILSKASQTAGISLTHFKSKVQDLWNALLNENFVFSFKNTLEISVYRKLEVQYGNWTWAIRSKMLEIENEHYTGIENEQLEKVETNHLQKEMEETFKKTETEIKSYFVDGKDKGILAQWRSRFEDKIKGFLDEQVKEVKRKLDEIIEQKKARKSMDEKKTEFENKLLQKSKDLAHQLKDKAKDEEEQKKQFSSVWCRWVTELTAGIKSIDDINLEEEQTMIIQELGFEWSLKNDCRLKNNYKNMSNVGDYSDYVVFMKSKDEGVRQRVTGEMVSENLEGKSESLQHEDQQLIRSFIDDVEQNCIVLIQSKPVVTRGYRPVYLQEMANTVMSEVATFQSTKKKYDLKKEFTVDLLLFVFHRAEKFLTESHKKFQKNNDALIYLESKKDQYFNIFRSFCEGSSSAVVFGQMICDTLKVSAVEAVCNKTAMDLAHEMKSSVPAFSGNRSNLDKYVLKSLAEKENFQDFMTYIHHPTEQIETFIREEVEKYIFRDKKDTALDILKKNVDDIKQFVTLALFQATEKVKVQDGDINMWVEEFSSSIRNKLKFNIDMENFIDINNFDFLKEEIEKGLEPIMTEMRNHSLEKIKESRMKPDQILIDQLCDCCWVKCPFCRAVCTNTLKDHDGKHSVTFHRSGAVDGRQWNNTDEFSVEFCTTNVASNVLFRPRHDSDESIPYKLYQTGGSEYACWSITPDKSKLSYWKWFVCEFEKQLEDHYGLKFQGRGQIPDEWRKHSKEDAVQSLDKM